MISLIHFILYVQDTDVLVVIISWLIWLYRKPGVEPEMNHVPPPSDASKKRLIEDTEDWHPRTGTSQSRSFRILAQLTGTENGMYQSRCDHVVFCFLSVERGWILS